LWTEGRLKEEIERGSDMSHLRFLRKGDLRWQRGDVITVAEGFSLIGGWVIVRRPVPWHARN
jgi:hypothetical protein